MRKENIIKFFCGLLLITELSFGQAVSSEKIGEVATVSWKIVNTWSAKNGTEYQVEVTLKNNSDKLFHHWSLCYLSKDQVTNFWNVALSQAEDQQVHVSGAPWNVDLEPNASLTFGYQAISSGVIQLPSEFYFTNEASENPLNLSPSTSQPNPSNNSSAAQGPFPNTPLAQPAMHADGNGKIVLNVQGAHIFNDHDEAVILKGLDRPSLEWNSQGQHLSDQDIHLMKEKWNANVVRFSLNQNYWFASGPVTEKGSYKQIINALIENAISNNMAVILDLHWTEGNFQSAMANQKSVEFWSEVATAYKDFGTVLFELFNEPYGIDQKTWLYGNEKYVGYQQLIEAVRKTGAKNICIINGLDWGYDLSFVNDAFHVEDENIVYGSHPYDQKNNFDQNFQGIIDKHPLIFTEFGVNQGNYFPNGYQSVYQNILAFCKKHQISYTAWAWWVENDPYNANIFPTIIKDWSGTPLNGGVFVYDDMQQVPGTLLN